MDTVKQSMVNMTVAFNTRLEEFQQQLDGMKSPATASSSPSAKLAAEFEVFRTFVVTSLKCLTIQVETLSNLFEKQEMRSRRKMLLVHGIPEQAKEDTTSTVVKVISENLELPEINSNAVSLCHRLGSARKDKPRPILIKLQTVPLRDKIWYSKTGFKGTDYTISEFLTKSRHSLFMAARSKVGVSKCWTVNGNIMLVAPDGSRRRLQSQADLDELPVVGGSAEDPAAVTDPQRKTESKKPLSAAQRARRPKAK
ncbi:unnamed protein product [Colias eurytheme]|nr:unnamed protein product [Colias eurytheme]